MDSFIDSDLLLTAILYSVEKVGGDSFEIETQLNSVEKVGGKSAEIENALSLSPIPNFRKGVKLTWVLRYITVHIRVVN